MASIIISATVRTSLPFSASYISIIQPGLITTVWSNFEVADMDFWRGPAYTAFFEYLDKQGGFYYEVCHQSFSYIA